MSVFGQIKTYATEDISEAVRLANEKYKLEAKLNKLTYDCDDDIETADDASCIVNASITAGDKTINLSFEYVVSDDEIYCSDDVSSLAKLIKSKLLNDVTAAASDRPLTSVAVTAADNDEDTEEPAVDDFSGFDEFDEFGDPADIADSVDDLADSVDELQDRIDETDPDEVNIDMDNNIDGHYIAECERCHGVFISAVVESDQVVDSISGICPLCEKETTQYLKWVIKAV